MILLKSYFMYLYSKVSFILNKKLLNFEIPSESSASAAEYMKMQ